MTTDRPVPHPRSAWTDRLVTRVLTHYHAISSDMRMGMMQAVTAADGSAIETATPAHARYVNRAVLKADIDTAIQRIKPNPRKAISLLFTAPDACQDLSTTARRLNCSVRTVRRWRDAGLTSLAIDICGYTTAGREALAEAHRS